MLKVFHSFVPQLKIIGYFIAMKATFDFHWNNFRF